MKPLPLKTPAPSFFWNAIDSVTPSVPARKPWRLTRYSRPGPTATGRISPGSFVAKATVPLAPSAWYSVMKIVLPATARFSTPMTPDWPAPLVDVAMRTVSVIQESSPPWETTFWPGSRSISRTGRTVPLTRWTRSVLASTAAVSSGEGIEASVIALLPAWIASGSR